VRAGQPGKQSDCFHGERRDRRDHAELFKEKNEMPELPPRESVSIRKYWRQDLLASLVVFLVALPLCMGIALASGAPIATGLVTGIVGGMVVGMIAGAPMQVSGPAAGLTVVCGEVIRQHGVPALGVVVMIAGGMQFLAGILRLGQWFRAVSPAVIHGMLSGIGVLILSSQLHVMVDDRPRENGVKNIASIPESIWKGLGIPAWEEPAARETRIELLQMFGMLHERQTEIERAVERIVTKHGSDELHKKEQGQLAAFVPRQEQLVADLHRAIEVCEASPIAAANGERAAKLANAMAAAELAANEALADMNEHRLQQVEQSVTASSEAIAATLGRLKNHDWAAKVGLLSIAVIVLWQSLARGAFKLVPAPLLAVLLTTLLAWGFSLPVLYVDVPDNLRDGLTFPSWRVFEDASYRALIVAGAIMAVIASAETLLCATAVDKMHSGPRTRYDKELAAQGIGNLICGGLGALPMTGVIVRSAANVQAGAKTRLSAILHGSWLLVFVLALAPILRLIPTAALAGILVYTGFKLIDFKGFFKLWHQSRSEALIFVTTLVVIVVEDLLIGVLTGVVLSAVKLLVRFSHLQLSLSTPSHKAGREKATLSMSGAATFLRLPVLAAKLDEVSPGAELHVDFAHLDYIDHACLELLMNWAKQHEATGGKLVIDWNSLHARFRDDESHRHAARGKQELPAA
jgi:MFS superfamily sulfate permease-like transporter